VQPYYKAAITHNTVNAKITMQSETREFLLSLGDSTGKKLTETKWMTCILGFCATTDSVIHLIQNLLKNEKCQDVLTVVQEQDHEEEITKKD